MTRQKINSLTAFGLAVRAYRQAAQLSQEELADRSGLHRTYVGGIERGERNIGLLNIVALAAALNTTASELFRAAEKIRQENRGQK